MEPPTGWWMKCLIIGFTTSLKVRSQHTIVDEHETPGYTWKHFGRGTSQNIPQKLLLAHTESKVPGFSQSVACCLQCWDVHWLGQSYSKRQINKIRTTSFVKMLSVVCLSYFYIYHISPRIWSGDNAFYFHVVWPMSPDIFAHTPGFLHCLWSADRPAEWYM